ncbi:MATE family efflux transporter [Cytophagaceae bacterium YF14B1]|uniref:Multidrug-efflux transporter n=1 Tax=Xanthocytophaga flava TaxID=3048013 RepID=A0AAE3QRC9_9BACT|nr:MATE family efflux transporter [Xanthocytophaga flavus]MDJ1482023.1 MATE family efflux transporter [Xanthocytophaga flavus]
MNLTTYRKELKETIYLGVPIIIGQLGNVLMGVGDTIQVGRLGASPVAASGFANSVFWLISIIGIGSLMVVGPQTATAKAQGNYAECRRILLSGLYVGFFWGIVVAGLFLLVSQHFELFNQKPDVQALATDYSFYVAFSAIPLMVYAALRQFTDGLSFTRVTMIITLLGTVLDIFLNWVFINGKLGVPAMGLNGAGITTIISRTVMAIGLGVYIVKDNIFKPFISVQSENSLIPLLVKLIRLGLPGGLQLFFEIAAFSSATFFAGWLGTLQQAAHSIALNMASVTYMVAAGLSSAGAIRVGQAVGLRDRHKIIRAGAITVFLVILFMGTACLTFLVLARFLTSLYTDDVALMTITTSLVIIAGFFQLSDGLQVTGLGILRGISDVNIPTYITLVAYWIVGLPMAYVFAFVLKLDIQGVWYGLFLGLTTSALLLLTRFYKLTSTADFEFKSVPQEILHG